MPQDFRNDLKRNVNTVVTLLTGGDYDAIIGIRICNVAATAITADVYITNSSVDYYLCKNLPVPIGGAVELIQGGAKIVVKNGDVVKAITNTSNGADIVTSYVDTISE